ncbi:hypothetical protein SAMN05660350_05020 [Geodermatophilus obscurus]|uniref:Uncharacterized protein n=1 Tax=Geodermatophilus obscurus TaxID=1861 RepID=A0A1M7V1G2_9ACTN|nr:hypothetical protein [Geodermatophilus obscurus]SHN89025.1 hypothetical protein SAMN05660350_05020 [Geodermatophilus obscurus]
MTTLDGPEQPADRPTRPEPREMAQPHEMSEVEKRMAEWEARHDVAARGHRAGPDVLQHYFAHERLSHPEPHGEEAHRTLPQQPALPQRPGARSTRTGRADRPRGWLRRLLRR